MPRLGPGHRADALEARLSIVPPFIGIAGFSVLFCWLLAGCAGRRAYARQVLRVAGAGSPLSTPHAPRGHRGAASGPQCPPKRPPHRSRRMAPGRPSDAKARRRPAVRAVTAPIAIIALIIGAALVRGTLMAAPSFCLHTLQQHCSGTGHWANAQPARHPLFERCPQWCCCCALTLSFVLIMLVFSMTPHAATGCVRAVGPSHLCLYDFLVNHKERNMLLPPHPHYRYHYY